MVEPVADRIAYLWDRYLRNGCTRSEYFEMTDLLEQYPEYFHTGVQSVLAAATENPDQIDHALTAERAGNILRHILAAQPEAPVKKLIHWKRWLVAASVILIAGLGIWLGFFNKAGKQQLLTQEERFRNEVTAPVSSRATLRLADGRIIELDTAREGKIAGDASKLSQDLITYSAKNPDRKPELHTLTVPFGSRPVQLVLADKSRVWLNTGSSITYPDFFTGNERRVSMTGEAYFEVAHNANLPFRIASDDKLIEVLGTEFNVSAYTDEPSMDVTLVSGSVKVLNSTLKPGQQAQIGAGNSVKIIDNADIEKVIAWKEGFFQFDNETIETVMRQLARWYDVEVKYEGRVGKKFTMLRVPRSVPVSRIFKILEATESVRFRIEGKKITVSPKI